MGLLLRYNLVKLLADIADLKQEHFICFSLDSKNRVINQRTVFIGTLTSVAAHPREIFAGALTDGAAGIIVAHNHPSGDVQPSKGDISTNQQLIAAGQILGVPVKTTLLWVATNTLVFVSMALWVWRITSLRRWLNE